MNEFNFTTRDLVIAWIVGTFLLVEAYYWFVYIPKALVTPGMNRDIDDLLFVADRVNLLTGEPIDLVNGVPRKKS
jgi:hypothetical protein